MNITGDQDLTITAEMDDNELVTYNASTFSGDLTMTGGFGSGVIDFNGGSGDDKVRFPAGGEFVITTGTTQDNVDGGDGTDELQLTSADADNPTAALTNVTNIEHLAVSDALAGNLNATYYGSISQIDLKNGSSAAITVTTATGTNILFQGTDNTNHARTFAVTPDGSSDELTFTLYDCDFDGGTQTVEGIETLNIVSNGPLAGGAADGGVNTMTGATTLSDLPGVELNITGNEALTLTGAVTCRNIDASTFAHDLTMGAATVATGGATITSYTGNDTIYGSTGTDTISSGAGNDVIHPNADADTVNVGTGSDQVDFNQLNAAASTAANRTIITGMTIDGSTYTAVNEVDALLFANITDDGDLSDGGDAGEIQSVTTPANITMNGTAGVLEMSWEFSSGVDLDNDFDSDADDGTALLSACGATSGTTACTITANAAGDGTLIIAYQDGNAYIYFSDCGANDEHAAAEILPYIKISGGVTVGGFVDSNFQ